jgi:hypothetical protein
MVKCHLEDQITGKRKGTWRKLYSSTHLYGCCTPFCYFSDATMHTPKTICSWNPFPDSDYHHCNYYSIIKLQSPSPSPVLPLSRLICLVLLSYFCFNMIYSTLLPVLELSLLPTHHQLAYWDFNLRPIWKHHYQFQFAESNPTPTTN